MSTSRKTRKELEVEIQRLRAATTPAAEAAPAQTEADRTHQQKMATDRSYAEHFISNSIPKGKTFTLNFECVDPLASRALFELCHARQQVIATAKAAGMKEMPVGPVIFGCHVTAIFTSDMIVEHIVMKNAIARACGFAK